MPKADLAWLTRPSHPLRAALTEEMHVRKLPAFAVPARLLQLVMLETERGPADGIGEMSELYPDGSAGQRFCSGTEAGLGFAVERHSEFTTYTFIAPWTAGTGLFDASAFEAVRLWTDAIPGEVIRATHIALIDDGDDAKIETELSDSFAVDDLVSCDVFDGRARIWSDFRLHEDGIGRLLIADHGLRGSDPNLLVQRLQELGNYRKMALLGLPLAQRNLLAVAALEQRLTVLTRIVADPASDDQATLGELTSLSMELATIVAETRFRMTATKAYSEICIDRMGRLAVRPLPGFPSLPDFTERRLLPAMRTCDAFSRRLDDLSQRAAWTSALLRTRVEIDLAHQNRDLLASMDARAQLQLRLQQTVEGLSAIAITYYCVGLVGYLVKAWHPSSDKLVMAAAVAVVLPLVAFGIFGVKRGLHRSRR